MSEAQTMRADLILRGLSRRHAKDAFFTYVKNGPTHVERPEGLRVFDALAMAKSWAHPLFTGYEIKVSRSDFVRDTKWDAYLQYCHRFYFACPAGLLAAQEIPDPAGLVWVYPESLAVRTVKAAKHRPIKIDWMLLYYIIMSKLESDRHPFFSSQREFLETWVKDKEYRQDLGHRVKSRMAELLDEYQRKAEEGDRIRREHDAQKTVLDSLLKTLEAAGVRIDWWGLRNGYPDATLRAVAERMATSTPPGLVERIDDAIRALNAARRLIGQTEEAKAA